jgi:hypothetical protein
MARKKKVRVYDPFDDDLVPAGNGLYRKRRWAKNDKTDQYGWYVFGYREVIPATDRETQVESPRTSRTKGVWVADKPEGAARPTVYITCPHCAAIMKVDRHRIKEDGEIDPCVVCPRNECARHVFMTLKGWPYGRLESLNHDGKPESEWSWRNEMGDFMDHRTDAPPPNEQPTPDPILPPRTPQPEAAPNLLDQRRRRWFEFW